MPVKLAPKRMIFVIKKNDSVPKLNEKKGNVGDGLMVHSISFDHCCEFGWRFSDMDPTVK